MSGGRMKILVPIKRVIDAYVKVRISEDGKTIEDNKMSINPFDDIAIEEALRLKEQGIATEVVVISIGNQSCQETIRHGLALGADRGIHIKTDTAYDALNIAKILAEIVNKESPELVIMGKQAIDNDNNQTGQMLAGLLSWPQHTFASKLECHEKHLSVTREVDGGLETLSSALPAVVTTDLRLNEPRYASLPNIMKAKRKPIDLINIDELGLELAAHSEVLSYHLPPTREGGEILESVDELLKRLKHTDKVIGEGI